MPLLQHMQFGQYSCLTSAMRYETLATTGIKASYRLLMCWKYCPTKSTPALVALSLGRFGNMTNLRGLRGIKPCTSQSLMACLEQ